MCILPTFVLRCLQLQEGRASLERELKQTTEHYNVIMTRREREHQEGDNLISMLRSDVERLATERYEL